MRIALRSGGKVVNIIVAESVEAAQLLFPEADVSEATADDEIVRESTDTANAALYKECLEIITGEPLE